MTEKEQKLIDGVVFSVVGELLPTSIVEGKVEDADYIAYVLWVPQTKKLIFKIWNKDGAIAGPEEGFRERFPFDIVPYCDEKETDVEYGNLYTISITLRRQRYQNSWSEKDIEYDALPIYPAIKCIILDLIRLTNDDDFSCWCE